MAFKSYLLNEASFGGSNLIRVSQLLTSLLSKKLGMKLYRYGGNNGFENIQVDGKDGKGLLLFTDGTSAYRLNFIGSTVDSVSIWKTYSINKKADYTLFLNGLNIIQSIDKLIPYLTNPHSAEFNISLSENRIVKLTEARLSPEDFYRAISPHIPHNDHRNVSQTDISAAIKKAGVRTNAYFQKQKVRKNMFNILPPSLANSGAAAVHDNNSPPKTYHISITPQDPITKKFLSPKDDPQVAKITAEIRKTINNPNPTSGDLSDPDSMYSVLQDLIDLICQGHINSVIVCGSAGVGKTYTVVEMIKSQGLVEDQDWVHYQGAKVTPSALYQLLFLNRNDKLILLDDADSAFGSEDSKNILKGALDSYPIRKLSWVSTRTINVDRLDPDAREALNQEIDLKLLDNPADTSIKYPSKFEFSSRIIFISNLRINDFDPAIISRSAKIDMTMTSDQIFRRIENNLETIGDPDVPVEAKREILDGLKAAFSTGQITNPSIRTFIKALNIYKSGKKNWLQLLDFV